MTPMCFVLKAEILGKRWRRLGGIGSSVSKCIALAFVVASCGTPQSRAAARDDNLAAAGFSHFAADTPERLAMMQKLPPNHFFHRAENGAEAYYYSDPLVCGCIYAGSQSAYNVFRQQMADRHIVSEVMLTASRM